MLALYEYKHARKVTGKGPFLKMKFFAPAFLSNEQVCGSSGLAKLRSCFTLALANVETYGPSFPKSKVNFLQTSQQPRSLFRQQSSESDPQLGSTKIRALGWTSVLIALLQSLCTAVFAISGVRVAIGLSALAAVSGIYAPAKGWHQDAIRIPMLIFATVGSIVNLAVIWWIRHLRNQPSAQWRRREPTAREKRSVRLQVALAIITLVLVGLESWTHTLVHRKGPPPPCRIAHTC